jgi:hypothetical protein
MNYEIQSKFNEYPKFMKLGQIYRLVEQYLHYYRKSSSIE